VVVGKAGGSKQCSAWRQVVVPGIEPVVVVCAVVVAAVLRSGVVGTAGVEPAGGLPVAGRAVAVGEK